MKKQILVFLTLIFFSHHMNAWQVRLLPVTYYEGVWYGLFGHEKGSADWQTGWTDFYAHGLLWQDAVKLIIGEYNKQTLDLTNMTKEYLEKWGVPIKLKSDVMYFVYFQLATLPENFQNNLTQALYEGGNIINAAALIPIDNIINNEPIKIEDLVLKGVGREISMITLDNIQVNDDIKEILQNNWQQAHKELRKKLYEIAVGEPGLAIPEEPRRAHVVRRKLGTEQKTLPFTALLDSLRTKLQSLRQALR